jgi:oxygen-independent coproporphyrinogen-3 oxidase
MKVRCVLSGHSHENEVQTIVQLFFPHTGFTFNGDAQRYGGWAVASHWSGAEASAYVYREGSLLAAHRTAPGGLVSQKRALMLSLFHALKQSVNAFTPWGSLTGIRPSKLVRTWLAEGYGGSEIVQTLVEPFCCRGDKASLALEVALAENALAQGINGTGLYIGIPFCPSRCLYCSFNTAYKTSHDRYVQALLREIDIKSEALRQENGRVTSVYIGGGTPTVLSPALLESLLHAVARAFPLASGAEYTVEAGRPDSITPEKLRLLRTFGVNRLAVNPQSMNDATLTRIGRSHTGAGFLRAFDAARKAGFGWINADIIAGLPGEGEADFARTLQILLPLKPENITVHTLAVKRASVLNENLSQIPLPHAQTADAMLTLAREACANHGYKPYYLYRQKNMVGLLENVGYAIPGYECLYNVGMMGDTQGIMGIGAAAVSKTVDGSRIQRGFNPKNPDIYIERMEKLC